jgi:hypothetical protein
LFGKRFLSGEGRCSKRDDKWKIKTRRKNKTIDHGLINFIDDNAFLKHLLAPLWNERLRMYLGVLSAVLRVSQLSANECM